MRVVLSLSRWEEEISFCLFAKKHKKKGVDLTLYSLFGIKLIYFKSMFAVFGWFCKKGAEFSNLLTNERIKNLHKTVTHITERL